MKRPFCALVLVLGWASSVAAASWRTSMSVDGRANFALALPAMLESGAPFFGTDSAPVFSGEADRRKAEVNIGELNVLIDTPKLDPTPKPKK